MTAPAPCPPDDFDAASPPPRRRPQGLPLPPHSPVRAGDSPVELFRVWDREGRTPAGAVLLRQGSAVLEPTVYEVLANPAGAEPLGPVGTRVPVERVESWANVSVLVEAARPMSTLVVMAPVREASRAAG